MPGRARLIWFLITASLPACGDSAAMPSADARPADPDAVRQRPDAAADATGDRSIPDARDAARDAVPEPTADAEPAGDAASSDVGPAFTTECEVLTDPIAVFGDCGGICAPDLIAMDGGFVLAFQLAAQRIGLDGAPVGDPIDLHAPGASSGFAEVRLAARGGELWTFTAQRPSDDSSASQAYLGRVSADGTAAAAALGPLFSYPLAIVASEIGLGVAWSQGYASGDEGFRVASLDAEGAIVGAVLEHDAGVPFAGAHMDMAKAADGYVACRADGAGLWIYRLRDDGIESEHIAVDDMGVDTPICSVDVVGDRLVGTLASDDRSYFFEVDSDETRVMPLELDETATRSASAAIDARSRLGVAFRGTAASGQRIAFTLVDASGAPNAAPVTLDDELRDFRARPVVAVEPGGTFGIAWRLGRAAWFARIGCE